MRKRIYFFISLIFIILLVLLYFTFNLVKENISFAPGDNAQFVMQNIPSTMNAGEPYQIIVEFRNTGSNPWTIDANYRLGNKIHGSPNTFGLGRTSLDSLDSIEPGQTKVFTYWVSAPQNAGTYTLQLQMLQEGVGWFGEIFNSPPVNVVDNRLDANTGSALPEPALAWISRSSSGTAAWLINRPSGGNPGDEGSSCSNGFGWENTYLITSQLNEDGTIGRKKITGTQCTGGSVNNIIPWGDSPDLHRYFPDPYVQGNTVIPPHWSIVKSNGLRISTLTGRALEEFHPEPALVVLPEHIIPDGNEHITQECYSQQIYFSEHGFGEMCYDAICSPGNPGPCPGNNTMINTKYRVYDYCFEDFCYVEGIPISVPINFGDPLASVLRVSYTLAQGGLCTGPPVLTEEQWYAEGIGLVGFSNDHPLSPAPNSVDFHGIFEHSQCLPYWDNFCKEDPNNYNSCCPDGHPQCTVYVSDKTLPAVQITGPIPLEGLSQDVEIFAEANDDVAINRVEFYLDNYLIGSDSNSPYSHNLNTLSISNGFHKLNARAYDTSNNFVTARLLVLVNNSDVDSANFLSWNVPPIINVGERQTIEINFENNGTNPWIFGNYSLISKNPQGNNVWNISMVNLEQSEIIYSGQNKTFIFEIVAPQNAGAYNFSWAMFRMGNGTFEGSTPNFVINVQNPTNNPNPSPGNSGGSGGGGGSSGGFVPSIVYQCSDNIDNDLDGLVDYPSDLGCISANDNNETDNTIPQVNVTEEESDELPLSESEFNIRVIFWAFALVLIVGIIVITIQIIRVVRIGKRFENMNARNVFLDYNKTNVY